MAEAARAAGLRHAGADLPPRAPLPRSSTTGVTGFLCGNRRGMVDAVGRLDQIDRGKCRAAVEQRFSTSRMVAEHLELFESLVSSSAGPRPTAASELP